MTDSEKPSSAETALPPQVDDTVQAIARFHAAHAAEATPLQGAVNRATRRAGTPAFVGLLTVMVSTWIALNVGMLVVGAQPFDAPPFVWLQGAAALAALYMTVLILTTQQRDDALIALRDQLTLELAILGEQKSAKIIALLEELRRDDPSIANRSDSHADDLSTPADPDAVLGALKEKQTSPVTSD